MVGDGDPPYTSIVDGRREDHLHSVSDACCVGQISCEYPKDSVMPAMVADQQAQRPTVVDPVMMQLTPQVQEQDIYLCLVIRLEGKDVHHFIPPCRALALDVYWNP